MRWPLLCLALLLFPQTSYAQASAESLLHDAPGNDHLRGRVALDPAFQFGLGYVRGVDLDKSGTRKLGLHVDVHALLDFSSWDLTAGASTRIWDRPGFDVLTAFALDLKLAQNEVHTALAYGYRLTLSPGYYGRTWYAAAEFGLRGNIATTIWQGAAYLAQDPDAANGTYLTGTAFFNLGATAGLRLFKGYFAGLRFAYRVPTTLESYGPWVQPLAVGVEFGGTLDVF